MNVRERPYKIGFLGTVALIGAVLAFMYSTTFPSEHIWTIISAVLLCIIGLAFAFMMVGLKFDPFNMSHLVESIIWTAISVVAIWIVQKTAPFNLVVSPISTKLFSVLMGVAEECFFRVGLTTVFYKMTNQAWLAIIASSGIWTVYHISRYGGSGIGVFLVIFMVGCVLGWVMLSSKMGDGVIFGHAIVNFLIVQDNMNVAIEEGFKAVAMLMGLIV